MMSIQTGAIYVRVSERCLATPARIAVAINEFWGTRGAQPIDCDPLELPSRALDKKYLGYLVSPEVRGWISVFDSEVYDASPALAHFLSGKFSTDALWVSVNDYQDRHVIHRFREGEDQTTLLYIEEGRIVEPPSIQSVDSDYVYRILKTMGIQLIFSRYTQFCYNPEEFFPLGETPSDPEAYLDEFVVLGFRGVSRKQYAIKLPKLSYSMAVA